MEWLDTVMKENEAIKRLTHQEVEMIAVSFKRRQALILDYIEHTTNPKSRSNSQPKRIDMTNHYVYTYVQAKGLKTIVHQKLLLCKTAFDHLKIVINPSSCDNEILQQLMQELKIEEIPRSAENDRLLLDKWKDDFFKHSNVDVS